MQKLLDPYRDNRKEIENIFDCRNRSSGDEIPSLKNYKASRRLHLCKWNASNAKTGNDVFKRKTPRLVYYMKQMIQSTRHAALNVEKLENPTLYGVIPP